MSGSASDASGAAAGDFTYVWSIDGEVVDAGSETGILSEEGNHTITLTAYDDLGNYAEDSVQINLAPVSAPHVPNNPSPEDGATGALVISTLGWSGGDPDGDPVTYDVYLQPHTASKCFLKTFFTDGRKHFKLEKLSYFKY